MRLKTPEAVARAAAAAIVEAAFKAIHEHGEFRLVLAGGRTPRATYELLATELREEIDWRRVIFYFGDERCVGPDDPASNYRMAREALFEPLKLQRGAVRRMAGELAPDRIRVNCIAPGPVDTPIHATWADDLDEAYRWLESQVPLGRIGDPADLARWIALLLSPVTSFLTGVVLPVDGGQVIPRA